MKKSAYRILKVGVACSVLLGGASFGGMVSAAAGSALPTVPISAKITNPVTVKEEILTSSTTYLKTDIRVPQLSSMQDTRYQDQLNDIILSHAHKDLKHWEKEALAAAQKANEDGFTYHPYELTIHYELKSNGTEEGIVSLVVTTEGAADGTSMPRVDTYNVRNVQEAARVTLQDLFGADYKKKIDEQISKTINEQQDAYFADEFKGIHEEQSFYVENKQAVVVFPKYAIAPGSTGTPEFRIPLEESKAEEGAKPGDAIAIVINGKKALQPGFMNETGNRIMLPLRELSEGLGFTITWNAENRSAELTKPKSPISTLVQVGKDQYNVNKQAKPLGAAPIIKEGTMYVPADFFKEVLQANVWTEGNQVTISSDMEKAHK
ncbi:DUF3298 domain-containing protein [Paenibacillus pinisoli]|uniref:DUF3298 domain-containing protein n=1 Tax=Paenibacillus pinisoli TaxID=1276110 RepID=A0A3A6PUB0_9BACL|nr:stalk domain-containing protein [Paenibacillus pinisoli]RJX37494.1 DUF3298 domain-containing protein [Paenibacillus pinisoli]